MKRLDFSVFALISPHQKPVIIDADKESPAERQHTLPLKLANSIRESKFVLPQVELLGEQVVKGPSHIRMLYFDKYKVADVALFKVIKEMDEADRKEIQRYLWTEDILEYDRKSRRYLTLHPPFEQAEQAFLRLFRILEQLDVLEMAG